MFAIFVNQDYTDTCKLTKVNVLCKIFVLTTSIDSPKLSSTSLETIFFTFWTVSVADCDGVLSKPVIVKKYIYIKIIYYQLCFS